MKTVNHVNNIPLHYARTTAHPYGSRGLQRNFQVETSFYKTLETAFKEVFDNCPFGKPEVLTTAGIFVNKPGQHGHGKAFDLDAIFWSGTTLVTMNFLHQKLLYLGVESFLRKHFGIVLNYLYPNHKDHWHIDVSVPVDYHESSKSETLYVQMVMKYVYDKDILIDGLWGPQTRNAVKDIFARLGIDLPITTKKNYLNFLDLTGKIAFKLCEEKSNPIQLLDNLNEVIGDLQTQDMIKVREALNSFLDHTSTSDWLSSVDDDHHDLDAIIDTVIA